MPTYDYYCEPCDKATEISKPAADSDKTEVCEICGRLLERVFMHSGTTFALKGGGWTGKIKRT